MEGAQDGTTQEPDIRGFIGLIPILVLIGIAAVLGFGVAFLSVSSIAYNLEVVPGWPPNFYGFGTFFGGISGTLLWRSVASGLEVSLLAVPLGLFTGYFLALKAPNWLRRIGVFLLIAAWALTFERLVAFFHFQRSAAAAGFFPWLTADYGGDVVGTLAWLVTPAVSLAAYAGFRGHFFGLTWPSARGGRLERWIKEALPRAVPAVAFGVLVVVSYLLLDPVTSNLLGGRNSRGIGNFVWDAVASFGYVTVAAVAVVIVGLVILAAYAAFGAILWVVHRFAPRWASMSMPTPSASSDRSFHLVSLAVTGVVAGFTLVSLFLPVAVAAIFSFNYDNSFAAFSSFSTRWWVTNPVDYFEIRSLLSDTEFLVGFWGSIVTALVLAAIAAALAFLASRYIPLLPPRSRALARACIYFGLVAPVFLTTTMGYLRASWDALRPVTNAGLDVPFALLPMALAVAFLVCDAALHHPRGSRAAPWPLLDLRAATAGFLVSFTFAMNALVLYPGGFPTGLESVWSTLARRIPTPEIDAAITLYAVLSFFPLAAAFFVVYDREAFTM